MLDLPIFSKTNYKEKPFNSYDTVTFVEATGGTVLTSGDFKTHVFTGSSNFVVSGISTTASKTVSGRTP